jgi:uncharacterized RDD family membrane protein YckC
VSTKVEAKTKQQEPSLGRRFAGYVVDWYVGGLCTSLPIALVSQKLYRTMLEQNLLKFPTPFGLLAGSLALLFAVFYFVIVPTYIYPGQTLGKRLCKIAIVKDNGTKVGLKDLLLRQIVGIFIIEGSIVTASAIWHQLAELLTGVKLVTPLMYVGMVVSIISALLVAFGKRHKAIHDYVAQTKVVMVSRETN